MLGKQGRPNAIDKFEVMSVEEALSTYVVADYTPLPVSKLYESLISVSSDALTAVTESDYIDVDYSASYHDQLGRSFTPVKRDTTRIHFFDQKLTRRRLMNASDATVRSMQSSYLGFTVIRPDYPTTLGRTLLKYPANVNGCPARFPTRGTTSVDLAGIPLKVESCPYMSQDQKVMPAPPQRYGCRQHPWRKKSLKSHGIAPPTSPGWPCQ